MVKILNIGTPELITTTVPNWNNLVLQYCIQKRWNDSVDSDQTALADQGYTACPDLIVSIFRIIMAECCERFLA